MRVAASCRPVAARAATAWPPEAGPTGVLSHEHRLTSAQSFTHAVRKGRRAGGSLLVVHLVVPDSPDSTAGVPARVGFIVSKAVGPAVTRNLVKRRLRHWSRERISSLPDGAVLVVRALPPAAGASYAELGGEFVRCLDRASAATRVDAVS